MSDPVELTRAVNARIAAERQIAAAARRLEHVVWLPHAFTPTPEGWERVRVMMYQLNKADRWLVQTSIPD